MVIMKHRAVALFLLLTACFPTRPDTYTPVCQSYIGKSSNDLLSGFGPPTRSYESNGYKYLEWDKNYGVATFAMYGTLQSVPRSCTTTFVVNDLDMVSRFSFDGNSCY